MDVELLAVGNAGFRIQAGGATVFVDAFYDARWVGGPAPAVRPADVRQADLLLVTHAHGDHFDARAVAEVGARTGAAVLGPRTVTGRLHALASSGRVVEMTPPRAGRGQAAAGVTVDLPLARVTAFGTFHGRSHNSYLIDLGGVRVFHDGDNEDTRRLDLDALGRVDVLLIGPWAGAGWAEFIERLRPRHVLLIHLTDEELDEHEAGLFLPAICDRVPDGLVVLRPGQTQRSSIC